MRKNEEGKAQAVALLVRADVAGFVGMVVTWCVTER